MLWTIRRDQRGVSNIIVVVLGLVIIVIITSNVILWSYEMNQLDWEKMQEDIRIADVARVNSSPWFVAQSEYTVNEGSVMSGGYTDTQVVDGSCETFIESIIGQETFLRRADVLGVTPAGKLMDTAQPPSNQSETMCEINRGSSVYFYTSTLSAEVIENGTWKLYVWASTASSGKISYLTVSIHVVSSDGSVEKASIGAVSDVIIDYGCSERNVTISGSAVSVTFGDRIRLTLYVQTGAENDPKGIVLYYDGYGAYETPGDETRVQFPSPRGYGLDLNGTFSIDMSTYPWTYIQTIEIQLRYSADYAGEKWYLKAYNWTALTYSDSGFNSTAGHTPTTGWDYYAVNLTDKWGSYVQNGGTMYVKVVDEGLDSNQTTINIDFLGVRAAIDGTRFAFKNEGSLTCHLASLWVINSTVHQRYDISVFVNSGETLSYLRVDICLPSGEYMVKVATERGNVAVYSGS